MLLRYGGVAGAAGLALGLPGEPGPWWAAAREADPLSTFSTIVTRREDQLSLRLEFVNLRLYKVGEAGPGNPATARLARIDPGADAFLVVHLAPQNLAEHAYYETDEQNVGGDETNKLTTPTPAALAWGSRLAFTIPPTTTVIPYDLATLMAWHNLVPSVVPTAMRTVAGKPEPLSPNANQTWIEASRRVVLSPHEGAGWAHEINLIDTTHGGRTELWHTRLGVRTTNGVDERNAGQRTVRAVWTPGFVKTSPPSLSADDPPPLGRTSLRPRDRYEIVRLSSDYSIIDERNGQPYVPRPIEVDRLMLSSLGAWLQTRGDWRVPVHPVDLAHLADKALVTQSWIHRAAMGRDFYVRVVRVGFYLPTTHLGAMIEVAERKVQNVADITMPATDPRKGKPAAFLRKGMFLVPLGEERRYDAAVPGLPFDGRGMPFKKLRITTRVTPFLAAVDGPNVEAATKIPRKDPANPAAYHGANAFWPMVPLLGGEVEDFRFGLAAEDAEGRVCQLSVPLVFVSAAISSVDTTMADLVAYYDTQASAQRRTAVMGGQQVALASFPGGARGEAAYPLSAVTFGAASPDPPGVELDSKTQPRFFPRLAQADVHLDAVERVRGGPLATPSHPVTLHQAWLDTPDNPARLFARLVDPVEVNFGADATGGVITPHLNITGLSALTGPMGGDLSGTQAPPAFDPGSFFDGALPEILGGISLLDILETAVDFDTDGAAPRLVSTEIPGGIESSLTWKPKLKDSAVFLRQPGAGMMITARTVVRHDGSPPTTEISGEITNFHLVAVGSLHLVTVKFRRLRFVSRDGRKPDVDADIVGVAFHGILEFVNKLQKFLKSIGVGEGPGDAMSIAAEPAPPASGGYVEVTSKGIKIGQSVAVPAVAVGVFTLENISLNTALSIPFDGAPARVRFAFAERERQFHLTVAMFGGGGFCGVAFGLDKFELFEAALEFGAKLSLDIGVASGSVSVMAGIYLAIGASAGELTGYLRINGELDILEIVSMSVEFYLGFTYDFAKKEVWGEASVTVEIEVLIFSGSVTLGPVRKRFGGGGADSDAMALLAGGAPTFTDLVSKQDWADPDTGYCALFAPAAFG